MMTAILTIDSVNDINESVTANSNAVNAYDFNLNNMGVLPGETLSVKDLLYGMLIYDAGEAANILAVHVSQSMYNFVEKMNEEAKKLEKKSLQLIIWIQLGFVNSSKFTGKI